MDTGLVLAFDPSKRKSPLRFSIREHRGELPALGPIVAMGREPQERLAIRKLEITLTKSFAKIPNSLMEVSSFDLKYYTVTASVCDTNTVRVSFTNEVSYLLWSARRSLEPGGIFKALNLTGVPDSLFNYRGESPWEA